FRKEHPEVTFVVQTLHHNDVFQALYERTCAISIASDTPKHPRIKRREMATGQLQPLLRKDELPDAGDAVPLATVNGRELVGLTTSGPLGDVLAGELARHGVAMREVVSNQTFYIAAALTRYGTGMTVVDEFTAQDGASDEVDFRPLDPPIRFKIECVFLEDRRPSKAAEEFITLLSSVIE